MKDLVLLPHPTKLWELHPTTQARQGGWGNRLLHFHWSSEGATRARFTGVWLYALNDVLHFRSSTFVTATGERQINVWWTFLGLHGSLSLISRSQRDWFE